MRKRSHDGKNVFLFFFLFWNCGVWGEREGKHKRETALKTGLFENGPHNAGLVVWFGLSSPSWAEEWKRLSAGMSGVPSNGAGRVTGQWERGLQSGGLIFSWWTQPPAPQCSLIARAEPTYGLCLEGPNDRTNSACREKGGGGVGRRWSLLAPPLFISLACRKRTRMTMAPPFVSHYLLRLTNQVHY